MNNPCDRLSDPLDSISVRDLFMALRWTDQGEAAQVLKLHSKYDEQKLNHLFEGMGLVARGMNRFTATELVAITQAYLKRKQ